MLVRRGRSPRKLSLEVSGTFRGENAYLLQDMWVVPLSQASLHLQLAQDASVARLQGASLIVHLSDASLVVRSQMILLRDAFLDFHRV